ncbi:MAG: alpha-N-arabinofuranosidase [Bacteroidales bacterium]|nr:MAG: alpha-N-arabinofuranosidase [Bacteroidales bacterium]
MKSTKHLLFALFLFASFAFSQSSQVAKNRITINTDQGVHKISKHIYGHFAEHLGRCIYGGIWVGPYSPIPNTRGIRNDVVEALKEIDIPNLRWPGGCFADTYHWKDGIGPAGSRPSIVNVHWGGVTEDNSFGTHEFMDLCEQLGCEAYICGNLGSGTVQEMAEWVEYLTSDAESPMTQLRKENGREDPWKVRFWALGNENWGCGGNMTPGYYADLMRRYSTYCRNLGGNRLLKIACGPSGSDYTWTEVLMENPKNRWMMQGLALHYYTVMDGWGHKGSATQFGEWEWISTLQQTLNMEELIIRHSTIMDRYDPEKRIGLYVDEWGNWFDVEPGTEPGFLYQQNTLRDALVAAVNLNIFNNHCNRVKMANIAQTVNVLQAMILTNEEKMIRTPSYYTFRMFKVHQDATLLPLNLTCENYRFEEKQVASLSASSSLNENGIIHLSLANLDPRKSKAVKCEVRGRKITDVKGEILTAGNMNDHNDFNRGEIVVPKEFTGANIRGGILEIDIPAKSVVVLRIN